MTISTVPGNTAADADSRPLPENARRLRDGVRAALAGQVAEFAKKNTDLIAVFDEPFGQFSTGRISLFQQFVTDNIGVVPEYIKSVPACVKVFFSLGPYSAENIEILRGVLRSDSAREVYSNLGISQIQLRGELIFMDSPRIAPHSPASAPQP
jgi:hypothetical protein